MKKSRNFATSFAFPSLILFSAMPAAFGQETTDNVWTNGAATLDWNTAGNWDSVPTGTQAVPSTGQNAGIENGDTVSTSADAASDLNQVLVEGDSTLDLNHSMGITPAAAGGLWLGDNGGFGTLNVNSGGSLTVSGTGEFRVGRADNTGTLTLVDGGSITSTVSDGVGIGRDNGSIGLFTMTGGTFTQTVGEFKVGSSGNVKAGSGTFNISNGTANIRRLRVTFTGSADGNNAGVVNQTGGTVNNTDDAGIGWANHADSTYNLVDGIFTSSNRLRIGQSDKPGATNHFNQTGGDVDITGRIDIGEKAGPALNLYSISAGTLDTTGEIMLGAFNEGVGTFTMSGTSEVRPGGDIRLGWANAGSMGTLNLNGGILYANSITTSALTTQANVVNMDGGRIVVASAGDSINSPASALTVALQAGGGTIDTNGFNFPIDVPITGVGSLTMEGAATVNLTATNTYTGDTIINGGRIFENSTGTMSFKIGADGVNNQITGNGTGEFNADGTFIIDVSTAAVNGTWTIVDIANLAVYNRAIATFNVLGWTDGGTTWTTTANGADYTYNESTGILTAVGPVGGYAAWATSEGLTVANDAPTFDAEFDGIENLLEYVLVGDPLVSDTSILPALSLTPTDYVFTFLRSDESEVDTVQTFQYGTNLAGWTDVTIGDVSAGEVTVVENGADADDITVTIPRSEEDGGKLFGRLQAVQP